MDCSPQAPLSMGVSRQEHWGGLSFPPPEDLPDPGIEAASLASSALAGRLFAASTTQEAHTHNMNLHSPMDQRDDQKALIEEQGEYTLSSPR